MDIPDLETPSSPKPELYPEQTAEEEVDRKVIPFIKRMSLGMLKIVAYIITGFVLAVSVPAISQTVDEVSNKPLKVVVIDPAGNETVEEAGTGAKTANAIGSFFSKSLTGAGKIKDSFFNVSERETLQRAEIKELKQQLVAKQQELITYKVKTGLDHGTAKSCALVIHDYLEVMEGN